MKKRIVLLSIAVLFLTGCSVQKLDSNQFRKNIDSLLSKNVKLSNVYYEGYKYYIPNGMSFVDKEDYNAILRDTHNNLYYLYVDAIGYYHKIENSYEAKDTSYYSEVFNYRKKSGYLQIDEVDEEYFVQFVYHYAKMESLVPKEDLVDTITYMCSILRTIQYNDKVLESLIGENVLDYKEEEYTLFKGDSTKESFMDVVEREETDRYKKDLEDEKINLDD